MMVIFFWIVVGIIVWVACGLLAARIVYFMCVDDSETEFWAISATLFGPIGLFCAAVMLLLYGLTGPKISKLYFTIVKGRYQ